MTKRMAEHDGSKTIRGCFLILAASLVFRGLGLAPLSSVVVYVARPPAPLISPFRAPDTSVHTQLPQNLFCTAGLAYISAMVLSIEALKYVNFPTKELGKSCKVGGKRENKPSGFKSNHTRRR